MLHKTGFTLAEVLIVIGAVVGITVISGVVYGIQATPSPKIIVQRPMDTVNSTAMQDAVDLSVNSPVSTTSVSSVEMTTSKKVSETQPTTPVVQEKMVVQNSSHKNERIIFLHHSTGGNIWEGGVSTFFDNYNNVHKTNYQISEVDYPNTKGGYPWANYPYDYWNLWVKHTGTSQDQGELNLDQLAANYDVIVFKHCYPVSGIKEDDGNPSVSSSAMTIANYKLQYAALKARMKQFPNKKFIVWTGAALNSGSTNPADAQRAKEFFTWVKNSWDEPGDNIFVWDFYGLETEGGLYMKDVYASGANDPHPNSAFSKTVAPYFAQRVVDVIEGRGDTGSITGK